MMNDFLKEFLLTGIISGIGLHTGKQAVLDILNEPDDVLKSGDLELYKYGDIEVTFKDDRVVILNIEVMGEEVDFPESLSVQRLFSGPSIENITSDLDCAEIGWHICTESSYDQELALVTESGVILFYGLPEVGLGKIQLSGLIPNYYRYEKEMDNL